MNDLLLIAIAIGLQGFCLIFDEFVFHWRRDLPRWERLGHPIDSLAFLAALAIPALWEAQSDLVKIVYGIVAMVSCLCVTKDEGVHLKLATAREQHLHGLMFLLHSAILVLIWNAWKNGNFQLPAAMLFPIAAFSVYQIVYWNLVRPPYVEHSR